MRLLRAALALLSCWSVLISWAPAAGAQNVLPQFVTIDVDSVELTGSFMLDGAPFPANFADTGILSLAGDAGDDVWLGYGAEQTYGPLLAIAGTYTPVYELDFSSGGVPLNAIAIVGSPIAIQSDATFDPTVASISIQPTFTLNGVPFPAPMFPPLEIANFYLRDVTTGDEILIGRSDEVPAPVRVVPGTYDVIYAYATGSQIPENRHAVVQRNAMLAASGDLDIDVPFMLHRLDFALDGAPFPVSIYEQGEIVLRNFDSGDFVPFGSTTEQWAIRGLIPGTYDATYSRTAGGSIVPDNSNAVVVEDLTIALFDVFSLIDVTTVEITPEPTLDGVGFPASILEDGLIVLEGHGGDVVNLGITSDQPMDAVRIVPGTFDVFYQHDSGGTIAPVNPYAEIATDVVLDSTQVFALDVQSIETIPVFTLDGAPFPPWTPALESGDFRLQGTHPDDTIELGESHTALATRRVIAGRYDLVFDHASGVTTVPRNRDQTVAYQALLDTSGPFVVDVVTRVVKPTFNLNAGPFPHGNPGQRGDFGLVSPIGGELDLGSSDDETPPTVIAVAGLYDVEYWWASGDQVPQNVRKSVGTLVVPEASVASGLVVGSLLLARLARSRAARTPRAAT